MTTGPQTINRAEFSAILQVVKSTFAADIFSDSQWAIDAFTAIQLNPENMCHFESPNDDLLMAMACLSADKCLDNFRVYKIAAHQDPQTAASDLELYHILGNMEADRVAKRGTQRSISPIHDLAWEVGEWYKLQHDILKDLQVFLARCEILRLDAFDAFKQQTSQDEGGRLFSMERALNWNPDANRLGDDFTIPDRVLSTYMPGASILQLIVSYLLALRWPTECTPGVGCSWYEITVNFIGVTGLQPPRIANRGAQILEFADPKFDDNAMLLPLQVWDVVRMVESAASHIRRFMGVHLVPTSFAKTRWHLGFAGYKNKLAGFSLRPIFPCLNEHLARLRERVTGGGLGIPTGFSSEVIFHRTDNELDKLPYDTRRKQLKCLQQHVAKHGVLAAN
eukprot:Skav221466  [mRNA]  locus=scaffold1700:387695:388876:+ [translate_table: standard]